MEKFSKKIDKSDISNYLPDNYTLCTKEYYETKFNGMIDSEFAVLLECLSRKEHDEVDVQEAKENIIKKSNELAAKIEAEFELAKMMTYDIDDRQNSSPVNVSDDTPTTNISEFNEREHVYEWVNEK